MADAVALILGIGLLAFWTIAILRGELRNDKAPWPGHLEHEGSFVLPDCAVAIALLLSVILPHAIADALRLLGAGGLLFLGLLDIGYLALTWQKRTKAQQMRTGVLSVVALGGGLLLAIG